jgi:hypothetical protein
MESVPGFTFKVPGQGQDQGFEVILEKSVPQQKAILPQK